MALLISAEIGIILASKNVVECHLARHDLNSEMRSVELCLSINHRDKNGLMQLGIVRDA
jgi:hypothetical protein